jgi:hypothetical protein
MRPILIIAVLAFAPLATSAVHAEDRYGPTPDQAAQYIPTSMLAWPGKQPGPAQTPVQTPAPIPTPAPLYASNLPSSIYAPPPPADAPKPSPSPSLTAASVQPMVAPGEGAPPRFYSVAREYGVKPDPITLSPQFLADAGATDLAEPPPLPPPHTNSAQTANMSATAAAIQSRAAAEANQASDATALN